MAEVLVDQKVVCYHCGDTCSPYAPIVFEDKPFCCNGCKTVYQLLSENELCTYYDLEKNPGIKIKALPQKRFAYLDNPAISDRLLDFNEGAIAKVHFYIPKIHCSSCIWLLENMYKLEKGIITSRVNFLKKEISISYYKNESSLRRIVEVLDSFGYTPAISLESYNKEETKVHDRSLYLKIGIAGFCASNIMFLSFPEYFGLGGKEDTSLKMLFGYLSLFLSLPVVFYGAMDYFSSAYSGLKNKVLNLDVPISIGISAVFLRSIYEVVAGIGPGYFDSLTGLIFFLLIGKWYQSRTYRSFSFERDYQSYFPISILKIMDSGDEYPVPITELKTGDKILVRNGEIIPADAILEEGEARIDYSFVTGEADPVTKKEGDLIYAGGRQVGVSIRLKVEKNISKSYLLQLWNKDVFRKKNDAYLSAFVLAFSKYFTIGTITIAAATFAFWYFYDFSKALFALTSVLLVACPCALALSLPFALNNCLKLLGNKGLFLKSADTVEKLFEIDTILFDKTGTITEMESSRVEFIGEALTEEEKMLIRSSVKSSIHPLSQILYKFIQVDIVLPEGFIEVPSKGISSLVNGNELKIGSSDFVGYPASKKINESCVYISINGKLKGYFQIQNQYRNGIEQLLTTLKKHYQLYLLSGDNNSEQSRLQAYFNEDCMRFGQNPIDKLDYIESLKRSGRKVLMLGDGLNDAGALKAADVGISVSDDVSNFSPACDGIIEGNKLKSLFQFIRFAKSGVFVIKITLVLSLLYNAVGLFFAVQGLLSPLVAAILMPLSSVTVVLVAILFTNIFGHKFLRSISL